MAVRPGGELSHLLAHELQGLNAALRGMPCGGPGICILCMCKLTLWLSCARTAALGAERSSYKVDVAVVYIAQTNGLVKKAIERGALPHPRISPRVRSQERWQVRVPQTHQH